MSGTVYTPSQVTKMTSLSLAALRNYCERYSDWFSPGAVPPKGQPREFTADDVRLVQFIRDRTGRDPKQSHDQIVQALRAGEFAEFVASHPDGATAQAGQGDAAPDGAGAASAEESMSRDIAPQIQALQIMLRDYTQREALQQQRADQAALAAAARERELQTQIAGLQRDLGRVEGELQAIKSRRPWWRFWQQPPG